MSCYIRLYPCCGKEDFFRRNTTERNTTRSFCTLRMVFVFVRVFQSRPNTQREAFRPPIGCSPSIHSISFFPAQFISIHLYFLAQFISIHLYFWNSIPILHVHNQNQLRQNAFQSNWCHNAGRAPHHPWGETDDRRPFNLKHNVLQRKSGHSVRER